MLTSSSSQSTMRRASPALQSHQDLVLGDIELDQLFDDKLVHHGGTADEGVGVLGVDLFEMAEQGGHDADVLRPLARVISIDGQVAFQGVAALGGKKFLSEDHFGGPFGTVENGHAAH